MPVHRREVGEKRYPIFMLNLIHNLYLLKMVKMSKC